MLVVIRFTAQIEIILRTNDFHKSFGKPAPGAASHFEFCCSFPQNSHALYAPESSIFIGFLCHLLHSSDRELVTTLSRRVSLIGFLSVGAEPFPYTLFYPSQMLHLISPSDHERRVHPNQKVQEKINVS